MAKAQLAKKQANTKQATPVKSTAVRISGLLLFLFSFLIYANTFTHQYALDDAMVTENNAFTKKGVAGIKEILAYDTFLGFSREVLGEKEVQNYVQGGRYRPLSLITFALEYTLFGKAPGMSHIINALLYGLTVLLLYRLLTRLLPASTAPWYFTIPFVAAVLFAAHPLHTEVVANIKGRDELLAFLFAMLSLSQMLDYFQQPKKRHLFGSALFFFLALLSKENAITFLLVIPLTVYFFKNVRVKTLVQPFFVLFGVAALFLLIRQSVVLHPSESSVGGLMNNPFLGLSFSHKLSTIFFTFLMYYKLLFFPHPLTYDYYPFHIQPIGWDNFGAIAGVVITIFLMVLAIVLLRRKHLLSYCILFYFVTFSIVSNIPVNLGAYMGERFLYFSSFAFCLAAAFGLTQLWKKQQLLAYAVALPFLVFFSVKTIARNPDWKNNETLFAADLRTSAGSAHVNKSYGELLMVKAGKEKDPVKKRTMYAQSVVYLQRATRIYPDYFDAQVSIGNIYYYTANLDSAAYYYQLCADRFPEKAVKMYKAIADIYGLHKHDFKTAINYLKKAQALAPLNTELYINIGIGYYQMQQYDSAIAYTEKVLQLEPSNEEAKANIKHFQSFLNGKK